ncbi:uncharacterized protein LY89DRAFT_197426 [Mollisia scopiformis]|uniref:Uncharacterized protein n=1 Tax=Mollisia scopiformis TaxID=149040 RepID=A0A194WYA3_MOLSC|nr:uncharacterized protein LY89DRAFT_197426 [Mollisia scopiformis]KUJ12946.1 hypothetical protein LY89DRAFT_197426 [Mollisia scopiformis]
MTSTYVSRSTNVRENHLSQYDCASSPSPSSSQLLSHPYRTSRVAFLHPFRHDLTLLLRSRLRSSGLLSCTRLAGMSSSSTSSLLLCLLGFGLLDASLLHSGLCCAVDGHCDRFF